MAQLIEPDDIDFDRYMDETDEHAKIRRASAYLDDLDAYFESEGRLFGDVLPWNKTSDDIRLRAGELSIWAGVNGHGKSLLLGNVVLGLMRQKRRCLIASFEMRPQVTLARMCRQASQGAAPTAEFRRHFAAWSDGRLWIYDHQGTVRPDRMLAVCRYAASELEIEHIVIDSLMKCVRGEDDYNGQKDFIDSLTAIGRDTGMHIHLVHHMKKGKDENDIGGKFDLKGSGAITDQADNVFVVWRNKRKQFDEQQGKEVDADIPDSLLVCEKQRNGEWEGKVALWFHKPSMQYVERPGFGTQVYARTLEAA